MENNNFNHLSVSGDSLNTGLSYEFKNELGSRLFDVLPDVLPSMQLRYVSGKYYSNKHIDGRASSDMACTIYENNPFYVRDWADSRRSIDLIQAVIDIEHKEDNFLDALKYLCRCAAMDVPTFSSEQEAYFGRCDRFKTAAKAFHDALMTDRSKEAQAVRDYLTKTGDFKESGRGWSFYDIQESGLGYVSKDSMRLLFTDEELTQLSERDKKIGSKFTLAIPILTGSRITGMKFRNVFATDKKDRYHALQGSSKVALSYIPERGVTDTIIVVEGDMDALHHIAMYRQAGYDDRKAEFYPVVATSGNGLTKGMVQDAVRRGINNFILALDSDGKGLEFTLSSASLVSEAGGSCLVMSYPSGCNDLDEMYCAYYKGEDGKKHHSYTANDIQRMAQDAISYGRWAADRILSTIAPDSSDLDKANAKRKLSSLLSAIPSMDEKELQDYLRDACKPYGIDADSLSKETAKDTQNKALSDAYSRAAKCYSTGNTKGAEMALKRAREQRDNGDKFKPYMTAAQYLQDETNEPAAIDTPYWFYGPNGEGERLRLPCGQLSFVAARSSHGKSRMLENLALHVANTDKRPVLYFTLEEKANKVVRQLINIHANVILGRNNLRTIKSLAKGSDKYVANDYRRSLPEFYKKRDEVYRLLDGGMLRIYDDRHDIDKLCEFVREQAQEADLRAVFVDYAQIIPSSPDAKQGNRKEEITDVCKKLLDLAVDTGVAIIVAAQLNREPDDALDMDVRHIADASDIEHFANVIVLLWNSNKPALIRDGGRGYLDASGCINLKSLQVVWLEKLRNFHQVTGETESSQGMQLYGVLAKNRDGLGGGSAVLQFNGLTGVITPEYTTGVDGDGVPYIPSLSQAKSLRDSYKPKNASGSTGSKEKKFKSDNTSF